MADVSARAPVFSRGSRVLDYWLVHAEGLTVQPLGARVEEVVVVPPVGRAEALIVRSPMTHRRRAIPAESIAAVEPSTGFLLLDDAAVNGSGRRMPRPSPERIAAARAGAGRAGRNARTHDAGAARSTQAGSLSALSWLRPRAVRAGSVTARQSRVAAARTAAGIAWLAPRIAAAARIAAVTAARLTFAGAVLVARGAAVAARESQRAAGRGRASLEAWQKRRQAGGQPRARPRRVVRLHGDVHERREDREA